MHFHHQPVPGSFVQIMDITNKDGTPLTADNWRRERIGLITMCWIAGGLKNMTPFFHSAIKMENGVVTHMDMHWRGTASTGKKFPVEVEPDVFTFESHTSIYRFRLISKEEKDAIAAAVREVADLYIQQYLDRMTGGPGKTPPAS